MLAMALPPLLFSFPPSPFLRSRPPEIQLGGLGSAVSSPSGVWGVNSRNRIWCIFSLKMWHLVATIWMTFLRISWPNFMQFTQQMYITVINRPINLTLLHSNNLACSMTHLNWQNYTQLMNPTARIINVFLLVYVYISILCLVYLLPFKIHSSTKVYCKHTCLMSHQKTNVTQQKEHRMQ